MRQNYLGRVHYIDSAFGRFVAQLEAKGMYENSIIAMSADNVRIFCAVVLLFG
jgi:phosphoglycerol transferase MdoB-like AlkP superfamily enzyme|eukprot:COSAG01_NODE_257_length_20101_cov_142.726427_10_plen_53_part_00